MMMMMNMNKNPRTLNNFHLFQTNLTIKSVVANHLIAS